MSNRKQNPTVKFNSAQKALLRQTFGFLSEDFRQENQGASKKPRGGGGAGGGAPSSAPPVTPVPPAATESSTATSLDKFPSLNFTPADNAVFGRHSRWSLASTNSHLLDFVELGSEGGQRLRDCSGVPQLECSYLVVSSLMASMDPGRLIREVQKILPAGAFDQLQGAFSEHTVNGVLPGEDLDSFLLLPLVTPVIASWPVDKRNARVVAKVFTHFPEESSSSAAVSQAGPDTPHILLYVTKGQASRISKSSPIGTVRCYAWQPADIILHMEMIHAGLSSRLSPEAAVHLLVLPTLLQHTLSVGFPENCEIVFRIMWEGAGESDVLAALFHSASADDLFTHPGEIFPAAFPFLLVRNGASLHGLPFDHRLISKNMALPADCVLTELSAPVLTKATPGQILVLILQFIEEGSQTGGGEFASVLDVFRIHRRPNHAAVWIYSRRPLSALFATNVSKSLSGHKILPLDSSPITIEPHRLTLCSYLHNSRNAAWHERMAGFAPWPHQGSIPASVLSPPSSFQVTEAMWISLQAAVRRAEGMLDTAMKELVTLRPLDTAVRELEQRVDEISEAAVQQHQADQAEIKRLRMKVDDLTSRITANEDALQSAVKILFDPTESTPEDITAPPSLSQLATAPFTTDRLAASLPLGADANDPGLPAIGEEISSATADMSPAVLSAAAGLSYASALSPPLLPPWGEVRQPLAQYIDLRGLFSGRLFPNIDTCRVGAMISAGPIPLTSGQHTQFWRLSVLLPAARWGVTFLFTLLPSSLPVWMGEGSEIDMAEILSTSRTCVLRHFPPVGNDIGRRTSGTAVTLWEPTKLQPWGICTSPGYSAEALQATHAQIATLHDVNFDLREAQFPPFDQSYPRIAALIGREAVCKHIEALSLAAMDMWVRLSQLKIKVGPYTVSFPMEKNLHVSDAFRVLADSHPAFTMSVLASWPVLITLPMDTPVQMDNYHGFNIIHALAIAQRRVRQVAEGVPPNFLNHQAKDRTSPPKVPAGKRRVFLQNFPAPPPEAEGHWAALNTALDATDNKDHFLGLKTMDSSLIVLLPQWSWMGSAWRVHEGEASLLTTRNQYATLARVIQSIADPHICLAGNGLAKSIVSAWHVSLPAWPADATQIISDNLTQALLPAFNRVQSVPPTLREEDPTGATYPYPSAPV